MGNARKDVRRRGVLLLLLAVPLVAWLIGRATGPAADVTGKPQESVTAGDAFTGLRQSTASAKLEREQVARDELAPSTPPTDAPGRAIADAQELISARRFDDAIRRLDADRAILLGRPDAYVQLGRALEGRGDAATARDFFAKAIDMNPGLSDAYWGFATTSETLGDLESALGGMRSFLHTDPNPDPKRLRIAQARAAIWEWESQLGRGPWGPTKGIMPGLRPEQQRRDGRGVAGLMPVPGTQRADGSWEFEIKSGKKYKIFEDDPR